VLGIDRVVGLLIVSIGFAKAYPIVPLQPVASGNSSPPLRLCKNPPNQVIPTLVQALDINTINCLL
jgi:hypothetical protein